MLCDGAEVSALIDWEIWSLSDPRLDLAWFLFFTEEAKHPMASNFGPTGMPADVALYAAYVDASVKSRRTSNGSTLDPLQGGCGDHVAHEAGSQVGRGRRRRELGDRDPGAHRRMHRAPPKVRAEPLRT